MFRHERLNSYLLISIYMVRRLELNVGNLILNEDEIEGFLERTVSPIETSGKADIPRRYIRRRVYGIITKNPGTVQERTKNNCVPHS